MGVEEVTYGQGRVNQYEGDIRNANDFQAQKVTYITKLTYWTVEKTQSIKTITTLNSKKTVTISGDITKRYQRIKWNNF